MPAETADIRAAPVRRIAMLAYDGANAVDVTGPLQVFASAERLTAREEADCGRYAVEVIAPEAGPVRLSCGVSIQAERGIGDARTGIDTLLVAGGDGADAVAADTRVLAWLAEMRPRVRRIGSVCSGAFVLAAAGLLDGRRATTHWARTSELTATFPAVTVEPDAIHVADGSVHTSAGVTAGIDMALGLLRADRGRAAALAVARQMVVFLQRPGGQSQFSAHLAAQADPATRIGTLKAWMLDNPGADLRVEALAERAGQSPRTFARRFLAETGHPPGRFVEHLRLDAARRLLEESDRDIAAVARQCGFGHSETLRRTFQRRLGVAPADYRRRFRAAS